MDKSKISNCRVGDKVTRIMPKLGEKSGTFSEQISVHFGPESQNVLIFVLKKSQIFSLVSNLTTSGQHPTSLVGGNEVRHAKPSGPGMVGLAQKWVRLDPKWDKSGTFSDKISVHLAR